MNTTSETDSPSPTGSPDGHGPGVGAASDVDAARHGLASAGEALPPLSASAIGRLFGVPLLIISVIVGCAVVVVLLFGSISSDRERSIGSLLSVIEANAGEKTAGVLLPQEKEVWQASRELALRLQKKEAELDADELGVIVSRLSDLVERLRGSSDDLSEMGRSQLHFVMRALALTESPEAVAPIAAMIGDANAQTRREALASLGLMGDQPEVGQAIPAMIGALGDPDPVVRTTACVALSAVTADRGRDDVEAALERAYFDDHREVRWNASLALARLGNGRGKSTLLDMLDRSYWEDQVKVRIETSDGVFTEYPMPPPAVASYLVASVEASSHLTDEDIWTAIRALGDDSAVTVVEVVRKAIRRYDSEPLSLRTGEPR